MHPTRPAAGKVHLDGLALRVVGSQDQLQGLAQFLGQLRVGERKALYGAHRQRLNALVGQQVQHHLGQGRADPALGDDLVLSLDVENCSADRLGGLCDHLRPAKLPQQLAQVRVAAQVDREALEGPDQRVLRGVVDVRDRSSVQIHHDHRLEDVIHLLARKVQAHHRVPFHLAAMLEVPHAAGEEHNSADGQLGLPGAAGFGSGEARKQRYRQDRVFHGLSPFSTRGRRSARLAVKRRRRPIRRPAWPEVPDNSTAPRRPGQQVATRSSRIRPARPTTGPIRIGLPGVNRPPNPGLALAGAARRERFRRAGGLRI